MLKSGTGSWPFSHYRVNAGIKACSPGDMVMPTLTERAPKRPSNSSQSAPANEKVKSFLKFLAAHFGKLSIALGALSFVIWLASGYVLGKLSPQYMVTVEPFEISSEVGNRTSLSGKSASDIVVDIVNDVASHASKFHGIDYYNYVGAGAQPVSLHQAIKIPVQTSYGIELKGISVDSILHLYDRARYDQWIIGGDVIESPDGLIGRIRLNRGDKAESWETLPAAHANPSELVRQVTFLMLKSADPERLGQSYLQKAGESQSVKDKRRKYDAAESFLRQWAIDDPQNWKPSYYLSLVYSYQDKAQEASNLASWSNSLAGKQMSKDSEIASNLAQTTNVALETVDPLNAQNRVDTLRLRLKKLEAAKVKLDDLFKSKPTCVDYRIQRARILDKEALTQSDLDPDSPNAYQWSRDAIVNLDDAIQRVPENGGLHEQHAVLLEHLVMIMKKQGKASGEIQAIESEEVSEYIRALELRPTEDSPLWGAVYAQIEMGKAEDAVDLARTITLLHPDSTAAIAAYIVALERAIKSPGHDPEREKEVKDRLGPFLKSNPDKSELLAVLDAFLINNDRENAILVATEGKRCFPEDSTFQSRMLPG
jgi:hypothetical protein